MKIPKALKFRLHAMSVDRYVQNNIKGFFLNTPKDQISIRYNLNTNNRLVADQKIVQVIVNVQVLGLKNPEPENQIEVANITAAFDFKFEELLAEYIEKDKKHIVRLGFAEYFTLTTVAFSTTRGILYEKSLGVRSIIGTLLLPLLDLQSFPKKDVEIEIDKNSAELLNKTMKIKVVPQYKSKKKKSTPNTKVKKSSV